MKREYERILEAKNRFAGINSGFEMLDSFFNFLKPFCEGEHKNNTRIYDYRADKYKLVGLKNKDLYIQLQNFYEKFIIKNRFSKYSWYNKFCFVIYKIFGRTQGEKDIFCDFVIQVFTKYFILLAEFNNKIIFSKLRTSVISHFHLVANNLPESINYTDFVINCLVAENLISRNIYEDTLSFEDKFIHFDFWVCSGQIVPFEPRDENSIKYSCGYGVSTLLDSIDYYLSNLILTEGFFKANELFSLNYKESFAFAMNYEDSDISKVPEMDSLFTEMFILFFVKKLFLNEYCFHTVIMSCFDSYVFTDGVKNILLEKIDPRLGLRNDFVYVYGFFN